MQSVLEENKQKIDEICRKYKVSNLEVFGSASTGQFDENRSDIDFLVKFLPDVVNERFDNFFALLDELTKLFNRPVDLVEPGGLRNPYLIRRINQTRRKIYASSSIL